MRYIKIVLKKKERLCYYKNVTGYMYGMYSLTLNSYRTKGEPL